MLRLESLILLVQLHLRKALQVRPAQCGSPASKAPLVAAFCLPSTRQYDSAVNARAWSCGCAGCRLPEHQHHRGEGGGGKATRASRTYIQALKLTLGTMGMRRMRATQTSTS